MSSFKLWYIGCLNWLLLDFVSYAEFLSCFDFTVYISSVLGEDGPSQMALEDIAMFRTIPGCTVFYPSDAVSTERAVELAANTRGICFIRSSRPNVPVIYGNDEDFRVGKAKV